MYFENTNIKISKYRNIKRQTGKTTETRQKFSMIDKATENTLHLSRHDQIAQIRLAAL
jgi:hypothetical protein